MQLFFAAVWLEGKDSVNRKGLPARLFFLARNNFSFILCLAILKIIGLGVTGVLFSLKCISVWLLAISFSAIMIPSFELKNSVANLYVFLP